MNHANLDSNILTMPFGIKLKRKLDIVHSKKSSFNSEPSGILFLTSTPTLCIISVEWPLFKPDWLRSKRNF